MSAGFAGFPPDALAFLRELAAHNERAWFEANRARYDSAVLAPMRALVADLVTRFAATGIPLTADPLRAVFRIHRDIRFSRDKSHYKTHVGAVLTRDGAKNSPGLFYLHVDPAGSFVASGFYQPSPAELAALRGAVAAKPKVFASVLAGLRAAGLDWPAEDSLARLPRGFEAHAASPIAPVLRQRHLIARRALDPDSLGHPALTETVAATASVCLPLLRFGWDALGPHAR